MEAVILMRYGILDGSNVTSFREQGKATDTPGTVIWWLVNSSVKNSTYFSGEHTVSLFILLILTHCVNNAVLVPIALSDHRAVFGSAKWHFNTSLLKNQYIYHFIIEFRECIGFNAGSLEDPWILWDAIKAFIRRNTVLFSSNARKSRSLCCRLLKQNLRGYIPFCHSISQSGTLYSPFQTWRNTYSSSFQIVLYYIVYGVLLHRASSSKVLSGHMFHLVNHLSRLPVWMHLELYLQWYLLNINLPVFTMNVQNQRKAMIKGSVNSLISSANSFDSWYFKSIMK